MLVAVFFHRDDVAYNVKGSVSAIHDAYDYMGNEVLDIFEAPKYSPDDINLGGEALGLGGDKKAFVTDTYFSYVALKKLNDLEWIMGYAIPQNINHEMGHMLNLEHTWNGDGCDDTPDGAEYFPFINKDEHYICQTTKFKATCWDWKAKPKDFCTSQPNPCDDPKNVTNNIMDYNAGYPAKGFSPCQVEELTTDLLSSGVSYTKVCQQKCAPPNAFFWLNGSVFDKCNNLKLPVKLTSVAVNEDQYEIMVSELGTLPVTIVKGVGQLGDYDLGKYFNFLPGHNYTIILRVNNSNCDCMDQYSQNISFKKCTAHDYPEAPVYELRVSNPFGTSVTMNVDYTQEGNTKIQIINQLNSSTVLFQENVPVTAGRYFYEFDTSQVPPGNYTLQIFFNDEIYHKNIVKID